MKLISFLDDSHAAGLSFCQKLTDAAQSCALLPFSDSSPTLGQLFQIQKHLQTDLLACDARLSLFVAAANSYRYESLLRPFPEEFLDSCRRPNINAIFDVIADFDRLEIILNQILKGNYSSSHKNVLKLLYAVLVKHGQYVALSTLQPCEFDDLYAHLKITAPTSPPTQIFEVTPSLKCAHTKAYTTLREQYPVKMGFYGGHLEELYAMLTVGCLPMNEPIKLTCNVDDALTQSRYGNSWGASRCGAILNCVAVVEYLEVPSQVTSEDDNLHVIVRDANCIQISYLLFFGKSYMQHESALMLQPKVSIDWSETVKWLQTRKYAISLGVYLMILSMSLSGGRGMLYRLATSGMYTIRKGFLPI
ncbi:protein mono-ADP-ribosyltransferase Parp16 [Drosophila innubila]|uniref:protein mono-ADP-ribosyltransferase Parp16 n=1 Tax=Drosophila innubila TaxID=198719 RepID=UPI00148B91AB|nr:protein mono-ADP-ribosyltransferase Parp16 [Drosophila innubila]